MVAQKALFRAIAMPVAIALLIPAVLAVSPVGVGASSARAQEAGSQAYTHPIAVQALKYQGQWGGQCWTFVRQVVSEATGLTMGFDYRQGFFDAGAWEVSVAEAREGDVIQLADDSYTAPDANYIGLHTAIILENYGDGSFKVVDSNYNWTETVSVHDYNPAASAGRFTHINFHIYRFPVGADVQPPSGDTGGTTDPSSSLEDNTVLLASVDVGADCLNFRKGPGLGYAAFTCLPNGKVVHVLDTEPVVADGYTWVNVATLGGRGWVAVEYLDPVSEDDVRAAAVEHQFVSLLLEDPEPEPVAPAPAPQLYRSVAVGVTAN